MTSKENALERRIAAVEEQLHETRRLARRFQTLSAALGLGLIGVATIAGAVEPQVPEVVQARRFEVIDEQGRVVVAAGAGVLGGQIDVWSQDQLNVARIWVNEYGGDLALWNNAGRNVVGAYATTGGGELALWDNEGALAVRGQVADHGGRIELLDPGRKQVVVTAGAQEHGGGVSIVGQEGAELWSARATAQGGHTALADAAGQIVVSSGAADRGGETRILGADGVPLVVAGASTSSGGGYLELFNPEGLRVFTTSADTDGGGRLDLADGSGNVVLSADSVKDTGAALAVMNSAGTRQFLIGTRPQGGLMNLMNSQGSTVFIAGTADQGLGGALAIKNGRGRQILHAGYDSADDGLVTVWDAEGKKVEVLSAGR
jgi:hypothetical protein